MRNMLYAIAAMPHAATVEQSSPNVCHAMKTTYQGMDCCPHQGPAQHPTSDILRTSLELLKSVQCFETRIATNVTAEGCAADLASDRQLPYGARLGGGVGNSDSPYSRYLGNFTDSSIRFRLNVSGEIAQGADAASAAGAQNFLHSMTLTENYVLLGVRDTPGFVPSESFGWPSLSGVYRFDRNTLQNMGRYQGDPMVKKNVMRYAPIVAEGSVFSTHWGYMDPHARHLHKGSLETWTHIESRDVGADFGVMRAGQGIAGPLASQKSDDDQCGTRLFLSSMSFAYYSALNDLEPSRPLGLESSNPSPRGRLQCYCSKTMQTCWDLSNEGERPEKYYFNGIEGGMPADFSTVEQKHVNTARSDFMGTLRQLSCGNVADGSFNVGEDLIPKAFMVELDGNVEEGVVLESDPTERVKLLVEADAASSCPNCYNVSYYAGHYNTPTIDSELSVADCDSCAKVRIKTLKKVFLDHGYARAVSLGSEDTDHPRPNKAFVNATVVETEYAVSSFAADISLSTKLGTICQDTLQWSTLNHSIAGIVDFSGITLKAKYRVGDVLPPDARKAVHSTGSNAWTNCAVHDDSDTLLCGFGNAASHSFDRYFVMKPVLDLQRKIEKRRAEAVRDHNLDAFRDAISRHDNILELNKKQMALLSPYDAAFKENAVHAINTETGELKWATQLEGSDQWFVAYMSQSSFDEYWDVAAASAFATDVWKDSDVNNVVVKGDVVYASTKGGTLASIDLNTGAVKATHRFAPGSPAGNAAPANYGGMCVTSDNVVVALATANVSPAADTGDYSWITASGVRIPKEGGILVAWDADQNKELWAKQVDTKNVVGGVSCIEDRILAVCPTSTKKCNYGSRDGAISQELDLGDVQIAGNEMATVTTSVLCDGGVCFSWAGGNVVQKLFMA